MNKDIEDFIEEFATNFSELFVETFMLRFLSEFEKDDLLEGIKIVNSEVTKKIKRKFRNKLEDIGYKDEVIEEILK